MASMPRMHWKFVSGGLAKGRVLLIRLVPLVRQACLLGYSEYFRHHHHFLNLSLRQARGKNFFAPFLLLCLLISLFLQTFWPFSNILFPYLVPTFFLFGSISPTANSDMTDMSTELAVAAVVAAHRSDRRPTTRSLEIPSRTFPLKINFGWVSNASAFVRGNAIPAIFPPRHSCVIY